MTDKLDPLALAGAKSKGARPWFLNDGETERLMNMFLALTQEVSVMRERMDTIERLLARGETVSAESIEAFAPTKDEQIERALWKQEYIARIFRILQQDREALACGDEMTSEEVADYLTT